MRADDTSSPDDPLSRLRRQLPLIPRGAKKEFTLIHLADKNKRSYNVGTEINSADRRRRMVAMTEDEIRIATEYLKRIAPTFAASVLKILYAYAEKSK